MSKRTRNHPPTVGSFLFDYIHTQGVRHAFALPGDFTLPTFVWLDRSPIESITMTHEPSVGFAADGYARINGLGLAVVTYCVGGLNMLNSIAGAYAEKSPVIVVSGGPGARERRADPLLHHKVKTFDTQRSILDGPFNDIRQWRYTEVCDVLGAGQGDVVETKGQLDGALRKAISYDGLSVVEVRIARDDASEALKNLTHEMARLRDPARGRTKAGAPSR